MNASAMNTSRRKVNAPSTISRKVGLRDEPGLRMLARNDSPSEGEGDEVWLDMTCFSKGKNHIWVTDS